MLFLFVSLLFPHWTSFRGVWSKLIIKESWMTCSSTFGTISYIKLHSTFLWTASSMQTLAEIFWGHENHILQNKTSNQHEESTSMPLITPGYFPISALVAALAMDQVIAARQLLILSMQFWIMESSFPETKGSPVFERYFSIDLGGWRFFFFAFWSCFSYLFLNFLTVLSLMFENPFLQLWSAVAFSCSEAYFPMEYRFLSFNLM